MKEARRLTPVAHLPRPPRQAQRGSEGEGIYVSDCAASTSRACPSAKSAAPPRPSLVATGMPTNHARRSEPSTTSPRIATRHRRVSAAVRARACARSLPSFHRVGVVAAAAHAQEHAQLLSSSALHCLQHARSVFLLCGLCSSSAGPLFSSFSQHASPSSHARTRRARTDDRRRTTRRAVRRRG